MHLRFIGIFCKRSSSESVSSRNRSEGYSIMEHITDSMRVVHKGRRLFLLVYGGHQSEYV